jgi:hypothetical protein
MISILSAAEDCEPLGEEVGDADDDDDGIGRHAALIGGTV